MIWAIATVISVALVCLASIYAVSSARASWLVFYTNKIHERGQREVHEFTARLEDAETELATLKERVGAQSLQPRDRR